MTLSDKEWKQRTLCSDGNCIGVIGADGRCKVCGLRYEGQVPSFSKEETSADDGSDDFAADMPNTENDPANTELSSLDEAEIDEEWEGRTLCIDESCIGIIGPDGKCKECAKPHPDHSDE